MKVKIQNHQSEPVSSLKRDPFRSVSVIELCQQEEPKTVRGADVRLTCRECGRQFIFTEGEQAFYAQRGLTPPSHCKECRSKKDKPRKTIRKRKIENRRRSSRKVARLYSYSVSGYGDTGYVYGDIYTDGSRGVSGYLCLENGREVSFDGDWAGKGIVEGCDENGNWYSLGVD